MLYDAPKRFFFLRTRDLLVSQKTTQRHFLSTLHPFSTVFFATATVSAFVLLRDSRFNFYCYIQRETTPTQKSARKITKSIHSSKPASLNRPIPKIGSCQRIALTLVVVRIKIKIKTNRLFHINDASIRKIASGESSCQLFCC